MCGCLLGLIYQLQSLSHCNNVWTITMLSLSLVYNETNHNSVHSWTVVHAKYKKRCTGMTLTVCVLQDWVKLRLRQLRCTRIVYCWSGITNSSVCHYLSFMAGKRSRHYTIVPISTYSSEPTEGKVLALTLYCIQCESRSWINSGCVTKLDQNSKFMSQQKNALA